MDVPEKTLEAPWTISVKDCTLRDVGFRARRVNDASEGRYHSVLGGIVGILTAWQEG